MEKERIEEKAYELLSEADMRDDVPVDVVLLAKKLGFAVGTMSSKNNMDGFLLINEKEQDILGSKSGKVIGVNAGRSFEKKRFIVAHELGHYKLHYNGQSIFAQRDSNHGRSANENEIDYFAACLLMPADGFTAQYKKVKQENPENVINNLAKIYNVPEDSIARRLEELNLIELK